MTPSVTQVIFSADHAVTLPGGPEKRHGHEWKAEIVWSRPMAAQPATGEEIQHEIESIVLAYSGTFLNTLEEFAGGEATAENFAFVLHHKLTDHLRTRECRIHSVRLEEEPDSWAAYTEE